METGAILRKGQPGACEPGVCENKVAFVATPEQLAPFGEGTRFRAAGFKTKFQNVDIRHGKNFSGNRRSAGRKYSIPYWGSLHAVMGEPPPEKWYQEAVIAGVRMPLRRKKDSNEARWKRFVYPFMKALTPGVFVELGCNAGFYCRKAAEMGFQAIGVERSVDFRRHAFYWESMDPKGVEIVEKDLMDYDLPKADVVLLANVHYWFTKEQLTVLVGRLLQKARRVIVIGRKNRVKDHVSDPGYLPLLKLFRGWAHGSVTAVGKHYSTTFINTSAGTVTTQNVKHLFQNQQLSKSNRFYPSFKKMIETGDDTDYAAYIKWRKFGGHTLERHRRLIKDVRENGIKSPLVMEGEKVVDGDHRLIIAEVLGIPEVPCLRGW